MNTPLLNTKRSFSRSKSATKAAPILLLSLFLIGSSALSIAQTARPPSMGEDTKGEPAIVESASETESQADGKTAEAAPKKPAKANKAGVLGSATFKESRRESGQVYRIELEHSAGAKQIIEENDSDGSIESTSNDIDDTPNLPKWKLGSWN